MICGYLVIASKTSSTNSVNGFGKTFTLKSRFNSP